MALQNPALEGARSPTKSFPPAYQSMAARSFGNEIAAACMRSIHRGGPPSFSMPILDRALQSGANPNSIICIYQEPYRPHTVSAMYFGATAEMLDMERIADDIYVRRVTGPVPRDSFVTKLMEKSGDTSDHPVGYCIFIPLVEAARLRNYEMVTLLIRHGAHFDVSIKQIPEQYWRTLENPFRRAFAAADEELVSKLLEVASPCSKVTLRWAEESLWAPIRRSHFDKKEGLFRIMVRLFQYTKDTRHPWFLGYVSASISEFCQERLNMVDKHGFTALHVAIGDTKANTARQLISQLVDIDREDFFGMSPLLEAVYYGHTEAVRSLLSSRANVQKKAGLPTSEYERPTRFDTIQSIRVSCYNRRLSDIDVFSSYQWSALHIAASRGFFSIAKILIQYGADIAARDRLGRTALDVAVRHSNYVVAFFLLSLSCPFDVHTDVGPKLLNVALDSMRVDAIKILLACGISLPDRDVLGEIASNQIYHLGTMYPSSIPQDSDMSLNIFGQENRLLLGLCLNCQEMLASRTSQRKRNEIVPETVDSCRFCQLVLDCNQSAVSTYDWRYSNSETVSDLRISLIVEDVKSDHLIKRISDDWHAALQSFEALENANTGSQAAVACAKHWIQNCLRNHASCTRSSVGQYSPTRLLDLQDGRIRLVCDSAICAPYIALSHRWGSERLPITDSNNYERRLHELPPDELTPTMRDAVTFTRGLGYRYLWIDALCIIQDSEEDWLLEAAKMSEVFSGAIVTIAVADAHNHSQGMFRPRSARCTRPFAIPYLEQVPYCERVHMDGEGEFYIFPNTGRVSAGVREKGALDTRGWILQEQILSRRILYFGGCELFWDCNTLSASESSPIANSLLDDADPEETWALKLIRRTLHAATDTKTLRQRLADVWTQIIKNYSYRQLSHQRDRLVALQGIVNPLARLLEEEPVAGMWRTQLWRQLIWWTSMPGPFSPEEPTKTAFPAPSWSWLSACGPVAYHNSLSSEMRSQKHDNDARAVQSNNFADLEERARILSVATETMPDARGVLGSMTISGQSFPYRLTANDLKKPGLKRFNASKWRLNTGNWLLDQPIQLPVDLQCIVVAEDIVAKVLICLCLVQTEGSDQWRRIGLCHWDGLSWQIARYAGKEPEEKTFTIV